MTMRLLATAMIFNFTKELHSFSSVSSTIFPKVIVTQRCNLQLYTQLYCSSVGNFPASYIMMAYFLCIQPVTKHIAQGACTRVEYFVSVNRLSAIKRLRWNIECNTTYLFKITHWNIMRYQWFNVHPTSRSRTFLITQTNRLVLVE